MIFNSVDNNNNNFSHIDDVYNTNITTREEFSVNLSSNTRGLLGAESRSWRLYWWPLMTNQLIDVSVVFLSGRSAADLQSRGDQLIRPHFCSRHRPEM